MLQKGGGGGARDSEEGGGMGTRWYKPKSQQNHNAADFDTCFSNLDDDLKDLSTHLSQKQPPASPASE